MHSSLLMHSGIACHFFLLAVVCRKVQILHFLRSDWLATLWIFILLEQTPLPTLCWQVSFTSWAIHIYKVRIKNQWNSRCNYLLFVNTSNVICFWRKMSAGDRSCVGGQGSSQLWGQKQHALYAGAKNHHRFFYLIFLLTIILHINFCFLLSFI